MKKVKNKKAILTICLGLMVLAAIDFTPIGGNNIKIYVKAQQCKSWPVKSDILLTGEVPHYTSASRFTLVQGYAPSYFCSPYEAERAGYSADAEKYSFPHLPAEEFQKSVQKSQSL